MAPYLLFLGDLLNLFIIGVTCIFANIESRFGSIVLPKVIRLRDRNTNRMLGCYIFKNGNYFFVSRF